MRCQVSVFGCQDSPHRLGLLHLPKLQRSNGEQVPRVPPLLCSGYDAQAGVSVQVSGSPARPAIDPNAGLAAQQ